MNGIILINKPKGCTSHDVVYTVKKLLSEKVGHTGTLDPMATGVLPLLIGKGTLCSKYLINHNKTYKVKLQLGAKTTTADSEGEIIEKREVLQEVLEQENIEKTLKSFIGKQGQIPPIYSAIKVNGKKLYEYARKGQEVEIQPREIEIYKINLLDFNLRSYQIDFEVSCSKGTYIRSLCEDIAIRLGTFGFMKELQRMQVGEFKLQDAITIKEFEKNVQDIKEKNEVISENDLIKNNNEQKSFISIEEVFKDKEIIELNNKKLELFLNGVKLAFEKADGVYRIYNSRQFVGTGTVKSNLLKRDIIL